MKLRTDACLSCALARGEALGPIISGSQLDALNRRFGVYAARPLLQAHADKLMPERPAQVLARQQRIAARFPQREARAPGGPVVTEVSRIFVLEVRRRPDLQQVARAYAADPAVEYCEPDYIAEAAFTPNDPYFSSSNSWGQVYDDLWGLETTAAPTAWDSTRGAGVVVAVVDTGIDYTHPDIAGNVWMNTGEIPDNGIDDDGNGFVDDVRGWDFADDDNNPMDDHFHGTHVAGTIAAVGNNHSGVVGVAFESQVMAVRALNKYGYGSISDLAQAILYAVDNGADVINASWGGDGQSALISDAIAYAHAHGVVFVAAAGNSSADTAAFFPANDANAITVAATTHLDAAASFSNFGVKLDVAAPGGGDEPPPPLAQLPEDSVLSLLSAAANRSLFSDFPKLVVDTQYLRLAGTSMATPHVAGTAALVLSLHPTWSVEEIRQALRSTADDLGISGPDVTFGYGRLNAAQAVAAAEPLAAHVTSPVAATLAGQTTVAITGSAAGTNFGSYTLEYGPAPTPVAWTTIAGPVTTAVEDGVLADWDVTDVADGDYVIRLRVNRSGTGEEFVDRAEVTLNNVVIEPLPRMVRLEAGVPLEIRGTAAGSGFVSYAVQYRWPSQNPTLWRTDGITLAAPPGTPVRDGLLATFVPPVTVGDTYDFRLTVTNGAGTRTTDLSRDASIVLDPTLRAGWPQSVVPVTDRDYVTVADLDGDGTKEILVGSGDEVVVFEPDGSVRPGWPQSVVTPGFPIVDTAGSPIAADVAGDGTLEVIATDRWHLFAWSADGMLLPGFPRKVDVFGGTNAWLTAADLNADGKDEIICSSGGGAEAFFGDGTAVIGGLTATSMPVAVGDVFGDGSVDRTGYQVLPFFFDRLLRPRALTLWALQGVRSVLLPKWPKSVPGSYFENVGMADLDGNGQLDVVVLNEPFRHGNPVGPVKVKAYSGSAARVRLTRYRRPQDPFLDGFEYFTNGLLSYADLDRDGRAEAYIYACIPPVPFGSQNHFGQFVQFKKLAGLPQPEPTPTLHQFFHLDDLAQCGSVSIGDVDGDGEQELVSAVAGRDIVSGVRRGVVAARADGTIVPSFPKPLPQENPPPPGLTITFSFDDMRFSTPAIADLDGDGLKEIVWVDPATNLLVVWDVAGTPGPELADWPMFRHDPKHTNALPPTR